MKSAGTPWYHGAMKDTDLQARFEKFISALARSDRGRAHLLSWNFDADRREKASVASAVLDALQVPDGPPCSETGAPYTNVPVEVPAHLVAERDALLEAADRAARLQAQVEEAEARAGWDPNP